MEWNKKKTFPPQSLIFEEENLLKFHVESREFNGGK